MKALPENSIFIVHQSDRDLFITAPRAIEMSSVYNALFLIAWFAGWALGVYFAITVLRSDRTHMVGRVFMAFWLVMWTFGGLAATRFLKGIFRRPEPETIAIDDHGITHNSGTQPAGWSRAAGVQTNYIDIPALSTMALRTMGGSRLLTVDVGGNRIELASEGSDSDREWLYDVIRERYGLDTNMSAQVAQVTPR